MLLSRKPLWPSMLALALATTLGGHASANNTIYTCKGPDGKVSLKQGPCHGNAKQNVRTVRHQPSLNADVKQSATPRRPQSSR